MPLLIPAATTVLNTGLSLYNQNKAGKQLNALNKIPVPTYSVTPEQRGVYQNATSDYSNPRGVSRAERANFNRMLGTNYNTQFTNGIRRGGGQLAPYLSGVLNVSGTNAVGDFAARDAQLRAQNRDRAAGRMASAAGAIQTIQDRNTEAALRRRMLIEQALGGGIAQQFQNISNNLTSVGNMGLTQAGMKYGAPDSTDTNIF